VGTVWFQFKFRRDLVGFMGDGAMKNTLVTFKKDVIIAYKNVCTRRDLTLFTRRV